VRPIRPDDEGDLATFFTDLSMKSRIFRFFAAIRNADALAKRLVDVNYTTRYGILAVAATLAPTTPATSATAIIISHQGGLSCGAVSSGYEYRPLLVAA
jgi:hypothetical protein